MEAHPASRRPGLRESDRIRGLAEPLLRVTILFDAYRKAANQTRAKDASLRRQQVTEALALPREALLTPAEVLTPELAAHRDAARQAAIHAQAPGPWPGMSATA